MWCYSSKKTLVGADNLQMITSNFDENTYILFLDQILYVVLIS